VSIFILTNAFDLLFMDTLTFPVFGFTFHEYLYAHKHFGSAIHGHSNVRQYMDSFFMSIITLTNILGLLFMDILTFFSIWVHFP
jgi:hypothetical protein